jgi:hypothetical protein
VLKAPPRGFPQASQGLDKSSMNHYYLKIMSDIANYILLPLKYKRMAAPKLVKNGVYSNFALSAIPLGLEPHGANMCFLHAFG